jgi:GNAT superfamily N-acetyltransferase
MNLIIRKWRPEDIPAMVHLTTQWGFKTTEAMLAKQLTRLDGIENAEVFIAEYEGVVAGRIFVAEHLTVGSEPFAEVHGLVVDEQYRRKGIGKSLIERARQWCGEKGFATLRLRTNAKRPEANFFYPAIGFRMEKQQNIYVIDIADDKYEHEGP